MDDLRHRKALRLVELSGVTIRQPLFAKLEALAESPAGGEDLEVERIILHQADLKLPDITLESFQADVRLGPGNRPVSVLVQNADRSLRMTALPNAVRLRPGVNGAVPSQIVLLEDRQNEAVVVGKVEPDHPARGPERQGPPSAPCAPRLRRHAFTAVRQPLRSADLVIHALRRLSANRRGVFDVIVHALPVRFGFAADSTSSARPGPRSSP